MDSKFKCNYCNKAFSQEYSRNQHERAKHAVISFPSIPASEKTLGDKLEVPAPTFTPPVSTSAKESTITAPVVLPNATVKCNLCEYKCEQRAHQFHYEAVHSLKYAAYECRLCRHTSVNPQCCFKHIVNEHNRKHTDSQHVNCILARYTAIPTCAKCGYASFHLVKCRCESKTPVIAAPSAVKGDRGLNPPQMDLFPASDGDEAVPQPEQKSKKNPPKTGKENKRKAHKSPKRATKIVKPNSVKAFERPSPLAYLEKYYDINTVDESAY